MMILLEIYQNRKEKSMNKVFFTEKNVEFNVDATDWEEAIIKSVALLQKNGHVNDEYAFKVINDLKEHGPYILISPGLAIPHTRPENGALGVGVSLITFKKPIYFSDNETPVKVMISFSATDSIKHLEIIKMIVNFVELGLIEKISSINTISDLNNLIREETT